MKSLVLPLALCAALAGCASYDTVGYGPGYGGDPAYGYGYGNYGTYPGDPYGNYAADMPFYGGPALGLSVYGGRGWDGDGRHWHGGHGEGLRRPETRAMGAGPLLPMGARPARMHAGGHRVGGAGRMHGGHATRPAPLKPFNGSR